MEKNNTEQAIMQAAEELFLEKGYILATTTMIAKKAGVTHAMLHYYFRTKDQIFLKVLDKFIDEMIDSFQTLMNRGKSFWEIVKDAISAHYDFLDKHRKLPILLYDVFRQSPELSEMFREKLSGASTRIVRFHFDRIEDEIASGRISNIDPVQLLMDIVLLNISTFMSIPVLENLFKASPETIEQIIRDRKEENIKVIECRLFSKGTNQKQ